MQDQIQWKQGEHGVTTTLTINCHTDGRVTLDGGNGFHADYSSLDEAKMAFSTLLSQGRQEATAE